MELGIDTSATKVLGMCVDYEEAKKISKITNSPFKDGSLQKFGLEDANSVLISVARVMRIELDESGKYFSGPYLELVGFLLYLAVVQCTGELYVSHPKFSAVHTTSLSSTTGGAAHWARRY